MADVVDGKGPFKEKMEQFVAESGLKESSEEILGPFSDITNRIAEALWNAVFPGATTTTATIPTPAPTTVDPRAAGMGT